MCNSLFFFHNIFTIIKSGSQIPHKKTRRIPKSHTSRKLKQTIMPKYVIEREIPNAGNLTQEQLKSISQTSCGVLQKMGPQIQWHHSYVTGDKIYCVYIAQMKKWLENMLNKVVSQQTQLVKWQL